MNEKVIHTADDEEPDCNRCDNCDGRILDCEKYCGPEHWWNGYRRTEYIYNEEN